MEVGAVDPAPPHAAESDLRGVGQQIEAVGRCAEGNGGAPGIRTGADEVDGQFGRAHSVVMELFDEALHVADQPTVERVGIADAARQRPAPGDHFVRHPLRSYPLDRLAVQLPPEVVSDDGEEGFDDAPVRPGEIEAGFDPVGFEPPGSPRSDAGDLGDREFAEQFLFVRPVEYRDRPERFGGVGEEFGQRPRPRERDRHRHADVGLHPVADGLGRPQVGAVEGNPLPEKLVDRVVLDAGRGLADFGEHPPGDRFVPAEVALDVDPVRTQGLRFPHRHADLDPEFLHRVIAGDHARPLVPQDSDGQSRHPRPAHGFGRRAERVGVPEPDQLLCTHKHLLYA